jgi:Predicted phosphoesterase or phosphohydrolase
MRYVLSDTHFDHENIIEYCDRPFRSVDEMNEQLVANWNGIVGEHDEVIFVGDLTIAGTAEAFLEWVTRLNGTISFVLGDHDHEVLTTLDDVAIFEHLQFEYQGHEFYCIHDPEDAPRNWAGWLIHGHHHNNWPDKYPFVNPRGNLVNVSVELLGYAPLRLERLIRCLERDEWLPSVQDTPDTN